MYTYIFSTQLYLQVISSVPSMKVEILSKGAINKSKIQIKNIFSNITLNIF